MISNLKNRLNRVAPRFGQRVVTQLASTPESRIHESETSRWLLGSGIPQFKADRLFAALESLEELFDADDVRVDLADIENVKKALARLEAKRNQDSAASVSFEEDARRFRATSAPVAIDSKTAALLAK